MRVVLFFLLFPLIAHCQSCLVLPATPCRNTPFDGAVVSGLVGWDFMHAKEKRRNIRFSSPLRISYGDGDGFFGGGSIGYGRTLCYHIHLGGRIGYRGYVTDRLILPPSGTAIEAPSRYTKLNGAFGDLLVGTTCYCNWLGYLILGAQPDQFKLLGGVNTNSSPFRNQKMWAWSPRFGLGIERAIDCHVSLGLEYIFAFSNKTWHETNTDEDRRHISTQNHQIAATFNFRI